MTSQKKTDKKVCPTCGGTGKIKDQKGKDITCPTCGGSGYVDK